MLQTFYAKNSGIEVSLRERKIVLRFFTFGSNESKQAKFVLTPEEAFHLGIGIVSTVKNGGKVSFIHKYNDSQSNLIFEKWQKNNKSGYGIVLKKGNDSINVAFDQVDALFMAELLKAMSIEATKAPEKATEKPDEEKTTEPDETTETVGVEDEKPVETKTEKIVPPDPEEVATTEAPAEVPAEVKMERGKLEGVIEAVRKDRRAVKVAGKWYDITDKTKVEGQIEKGKKASVYYSKGDRKLFANAVYVK
ncbi:hypothetical protein [Thermodesulfovibrio yellowstonii]|uniref:hypothetical protein n=1 Tax=Thermodesulfovibrio yellowstonii TaxID=28262 RepID=UPI00040A1C90|nr:hypothetical protein [Thermodesulfovibrio islandicus]